MFWNILLGVILLISSAVIFRVFIKIVTSDSAAYRNLSKSTESFSKAIKGDLSAYRKGHYCDEVAKGIVYNRKTNRYQLQGRISNEVVDSIGR